MNNKWCYLSMTCLIVKTAYEEHWFHSVLDATRWITSYYGLDFLNMYDKISNQLQLVVDTFNPIKDDNLGMYIYRPF